METTERETPKIAEKVRFWEEQDRINQELIPRVLKQHELFTKHIEGHETASDLIADVEARTKEAIELAKSQAASDSEERVVALEASMTATITIARRQAFVVSGVSLLLALCSLAFAALVS